MNTEIIKFLTLIKLATAEKFPYAEIAIAENEFKGFYRVALSFVYEEDYESFDKFHTDLQMKYSGSEFPKFILGVNDVIESKASENHLVYASLLGMQIYETEYVGAWASMNLFNPSAGKMFKYTLNGSLLNGLEQEEVFVETVIAGENAPINSADKQLALAA